MSHAAMLSAQTHENDFVARPRPHRVRRPLHGIRRHDPRPQAQHRSSTRSRSSAIRSISRSRSACIELACTALFAIPRTSVLGALLLTAYLGGATATQVSVEVRLVSDHLSQPDRRARSGEVSRCATLASARCFSTTHSHNG